MGKRIFAIFLIALHLVVYAGAQDSGQKPVSRQLDAMTRPNCERMQAAMDSAAAEMMNNPSDMLFAVIHPAVTERNLARGYGAQVGAWVKTRRFDPTRITIGFGAEQEVGQVVLIAVPPGADVPKLEGLWARTSAFFEIPVKAELIATETEDENPCFSDNRALEDLGDFLKDNPAASARIVIKMASAREFREEAKQIRERLLTEYGIPAGRLRVVHVRTPAWPKGPMKETQYWLLPKTTRK